MEAIQQTIQAALPGLTETKLTAVMNHLQGMGFSDVDDLQYLQCEKDLNGILLPVELRKLAARMTAHLTESPMTPNRSVPETTSPGVPLNITPSHSTSPSVSEPSLRRTPECWAENFEIPWTFMPTSFVHACQTKVRVTKKDMLETVRRLGDAIARTSKDPGSANLRVIARKMVNEYPESLSDYANGRILGEGFSSLHHRLIRYFENRSVKHSENSLKRKLLHREDIAAEENEVAECEMPSKKAKKGLQCAKDSYGCINWQPPNLPEGETEESQEEKRLWLLAEFAKVKSDRDQIRVASFMDVTYASQRYFINSQTATVSVVREQWPFLLTIDGMLDHFNMLMGFSLIARADSYFTDHGKQVYRYAKLLGNDADQKAASKLGRISKIVQAETPKKVGSMLLLPGLLKEDAGNLFKTFEEDVDPRDMEGLASYPHVAIAGQCAFGERESCYVVADGCVICGPLNFRLAFLGMFAMYYMLNVAYPACSSSTLEFIQRSHAQEPKSFIEILIHASDYEHSTLWVTWFLILRSVAGINPERGSKTATGTKRKAPAALSRRVVALNNALLEFSSRH